MSTKEVFEPGSLFQIDATMTDVHVVSPRNTNQIIGRPLIHVITDTFSQRIVDISVAIEPKPPRDQREEG